MPWKRRLLFCTTMVCVKSQGNPSKEIHIWVLVKGRHARREKTVVLHSHPRGDTSPTGYVKPPVHCRERSATSECLLMQDIVSKKTLLWKTFEHSVENQVQPPLTKPAGHRIKEDPAALLWKTFEHSREPPSPHSDKSENKLLLRQDFFSAAPHVQIKR